MSRVLGCRVLLSGFRYSILKPDIGVVTEMNDLARDCRKCRVFGQRSTRPQIESCGFGNKSQAIRAERLPYYCHRPLAPMDLHDARHQR
jgi:hypothetical protein